MSNREGSRWAVSVWVALAIAASIPLATLSVGFISSIAKAQPPDTDSAPAPTAAPLEKPTGKTTRARERAAKAKAKAGGNANAKNAPQPKALPNAADPLAKAGAAPKGGADAGAGKVAAEEPAHYRLKLGMSDDTTLVVHYYPAKIDTNTPVLLLIHEKERSSKDFETAITELKGKGAAEHFQAIGYAVVAVDLRGHGLNKRGPLKKQDWLDMVYDLQTVYDFLIDRHNRGELNVAKLGILALGEGSNLAATWASLPGAAVSSEGRTTDLGALALISPTLDWEATSFDTQMKDLGPRIPILLASGERDAPSKAALQKVRGGLEKIRQNLVKFFPTLLHGYKLLQLEPGVIATLDGFFDETIKTKAIDWEPRYNLTPAPFSDVELVLKPIKASEKGKDAKAAAAPAEPDKADEAKPKSEAKDKPMEKEENPAKVLDNPRPKN